MNRFDRTPKSSYWLHTVTTGLSHTVSDISRDTMWKTPRSTVYLRIILKLFGTVLVFLSTGYNAAYFRPPPVISSTDINIIYIRHCWWKSEKLDCTLVR